MRHRDAHHDCLCDSDCLVDVRAQLIERLQCDIDARTVASPHAKSSRPSDALIVKRLYILIIKHSSVQVIRMQPTTTMTPPRSSVVIVNIRGPSSAAGDDDIDE